MAESLKNTVNVIVTDDQQLFREGLMKLIRSWNRAGKVSEASGGQDLLNKLEVEQWDIVLLDIDMPGMNGVQTLTNLRQKYPEQKVIILTQVENEAILKDLIRLGISGFILKNIRFTELTKALNMVADGSEYFTSTITRILYKFLMNNQGKKEIEPNTVSLSDREIEVLRCTCKQLSAEETAEALFLSVSSVKKYRMSLLEKTQSKNTVGLLIYALKTGLFTLDDLA